MAHESAVTALYMAARNLAGSFEELITEVINLGGDVDTIGAMAGGIYGAAHGRGRLPSEPLALLEDRSEIEQLAERLTAAAEFRWLDEDV